VSDIDEKPDFALVRGVVYKRVRELTRNGERVSYLRVSVPPESAPGRASRWPARYAEHKLPEHEAIDRIRAREIQAASLDRIRTTAAESPGGTR